MSEHKKKYLTYSESRPNMLEDMVSPVTGRGDGHTAQ